MPFVTLVLPEGTFDPGIAAPSLSGEDERRQRAPRVRPAGGEVSGMPEISRFYGIVLKMYYNDHVPPHMYAEYGEYELVVAFAPIMVLSGSVPFRVRSMLLEWAALHQQELLRNWDRCRPGQAPLPIAPLE